LEGTDSKEKSLCVALQTGGAWKNAKVNFQTTTSSSSREKYLSATVSVLPFSSKRTLQTLSGAQTMKATISLVYCHQHTAWTLSHAIPIIMQGRNWKLHSSKTIA